MKGRFLQEHFHGEMMGKTFCGRTLMGYDNVKEVFNSVWISDMQTSMFFTEGKGGKDNKVIAQEGSSTCPAAGRTDLPVRTVCRLLTPDKRVFEMYGGGRGEDVKTMEITYTRR